VRVTLSAGTRPKSPAGFEDHWVQCSPGLSSHTRTPRKFSELLAGLGWHGKWVSAIFVLELLRTQGQQLDPQHLRGVLRSIEAISQWCMAIEFLRFLKSQGLRRTAVATGFLGGVLDKQCGDVHKRWMLMLALVSQAAIDSIPSRPALGVLPLVAYAGAAEWQRALSELSSASISLASVGDRDRVTCQNSLVNACCRAEHWRMAVALFVG